MRYLVHLVHQICAIGGRKVIIFTDWPFTQWVVEWSLMNLGYKVIGISIAHKSSDREAAVDAFNDRHSLSDVLVTSTRLMATGYNLQYNCSDMIIADCPQGEANALQCGGRILRIGQTRVCYLYTTLQTVTQPSQNATSEFPRFTSSEA